MKGWTPQAVEQASKPVFVAPDARTPPTKGKTQPTDNEAPTEEVTPPIPAASQHYVGPYHIQVALGTHYPGRTRLVVTGPTAPGLPEAIAAAIHQFHCKP